MTEDNWMKWYKAKSDAIEELSKFVSVEDATKIVDALAHDAIWGLGVFNHG